MNLCVFTGSSDGARSAYADAATALGQTLARRDIGLVYGGAMVGLMGKVADGALDAGGKVHGVLPKALADLELAHPNLTELRIVGSMHERKMAMADLSDGFIAMPGGIGTLEETFEVWTWTQLGFHTKPVGLLNVEGFYDPLLAFLDHVVAERFVKPIHREMLVVSADPEELIEKLIAADIAVVPKWVGSDDR